MRKTSLALPAILILAGLLVALAGCGPSVKTEPYVVGAIFSITGKGRAA